MKHDSRQHELDIAALRDSEERLRTILETAVEGIITIDERGLIESINPAAERLFGYTREELIGKNVSTLMPQPYRAHHDQYVSNYVHTGHAKIIGIGREVVGQRKDGSVFPMDLSVGELKLANRRMFTGIVRDISSRKRLEKELLEISDREQRRIGQDLHDGLCQHLAGIELMSEVLQQNLQEKTPKEAERLGEIAGLVRDAISQTRQLARGLSPVTFDSEGLMSALTELAANTEKLFRVKCRFDCPHRVLIDDHAISTHLFRIAQEAVSNAIKHGKATQITLRLHRHGERAVIMVKDNGSGIPDIQQPTAGMGLRIMQYRSGMIGGSLSIQREPEGGTSVICSAHITNRSPEQADNTSEQPSSTE